MTTPTPRVTAFLAELHSLCEKHGLGLSYGDGRITVVDAPDSDDVHDFYDDTREALIATKIKYLRAEWAERHKLGQRSIIRSYVQSIHHLRGTVSRSEPYLKRKREAERLARQMKEMAEADAYVQELIAKGVFSKHPKDMTGEELKVAAERYEAHGRERKGR